VGEDRKKRRTHLNLNTREKEGKRKIPQEKEKKVYSPRGGPLMGGNREEPPRGKKMGGNLERNER